VFNLDLLDDSGEVRLSGFTQAAESFYDILEENQVYFFKNFSVKPANRQFSQLDNDYEIQFTGETQVLPCLENNDTIPTISFNFVDIASIENAEPNSFVDVIGICKRIGELQRFTSRTTNKEFVKRDIFLVDKTNREICLTLWDKVAEDFTDDSQPVVAAKRVKVSDFSGKSLSLPGSSLFQVNPDITEAHFLRGWYDNEGSKLNPQSLTAAKVGGAGGGTPWKLLREANSASELLGDKADYFMSKVTIMSFKRETAMYKACPSPDCKKKVIDNGNGLFRCEKCNKEFPEFRWRVMLQVDFADVSDHIWATCFQETGEQILGNDSETLGRIFSENADAFDALIKEALFKTYIVKFKSKMETFNGENRLKATVMDLHPIKFAEYAKQLLAEIKESSDM
jgi:replication factor A1